jgi:hypothetical protein
MGRDLLYQDLVRRLAPASRDELRIVERVLARLEIGRQRYGLLDLSADRRDWRRERFEERLDALVYDVAGELAEEDAAHASQQSAAAAELAELRAWEERDRQTVVSSVSTRIALEDIAEPYDEYDWDRSEFAGGGESG